MARLIPLAANYRASRRLTAQTSCIQKRKLSCGPRGNSIPKYEKGESGSDTASRRAVEKTELHQIGLVDFLDRAGVLADRGGDRVQTDGSTGVFIEDCAHHFLVNLVKPVRVNFEQIERNTGHSTADRTVGPYLRIVPDPAQEPIGDAGRSPAAPGDLFRTSVVDHDAQHAGRAENDLRQVGNIVRG